MYKKKGGINIRFEMMTTKLISLDFTPLFLRMTIVPAHTQRILV